MSVSVSVSVSLSISIYFSYVLSFIPSLCACLSVFTVHHFAYFFLLRNVDLIGEVVQEAAHAVRPECITVSLCVFV